MQRALLWIEVPERDRWQKDECVGCGAYGRPGEPAFFLEWEMEGPGPWICDVCVFEGRAVEGQAVEVRPVHLAWMQGSSEGWRAAYRDAKESGRLVSAPFDDLLGHT